MSFNATQANNVPNAVGIDTLTRAFWFSFFSFSTQKGAGGAMV